VRAELPNRFCALHERAHRSCAGAYAQPPRPSRQQKLVTDAGEIYASTVGCIRCCQTIISRKYISQDCRVQVIFQQFLTRKLLIANELYKNSLLTNEYSALFTMHLPYAAPAPHLPRIHPIVHRRPSWSTVLRCVQSSVTPWAKDVLVIDL
jgi:hypothetical protein